MNMDIMRMQAQAISWLRATYMYHAHSYQSIKPNTRYDGIYA